MNRRLFAFFGLIILVAHMLLTAFVPVEILLLGNHDHIVLGSIFEDDWRVHERAHVQMAVARHENDTHKSAASRSMLYDTLHQDAAHIVSVLGDDFNSLIARRGATQATLPQTPLMLGGPYQYTPVPCPPMIVSSLLTLRVPHPPPRTQFS